MKVEYNYLFQQFADVDAYIDDIRELVRSGQFTLGPYVERFEKKFAEYIGVKHVISVNTGTDALILALRAAGVQAGDEVITVANTFYATAGAIVALGARPIFVDCDIRYSIDPSKIENAITSRTKAILPVHWAGAPPAMGRIMEIASRYEIPVVEDACPAVGAKIKERFAGTFGLVNAFSMHPLKPLNVWGDGGMVVTNDESIADYLRLYRNHGMIDRDHLEIWGINARLQPVQAIVAMRLLDSMELTIDARIRNASRLDEQLRELEGFVSLPPRPEEYREVYQLYIVSVKSRDRLLRYLIDSGVDAKIHYPVPLHLQKPARAMGYKENDFPVAEKQAHEIITLPCHQHLTFEQIDYVAEKIREFYISEKADS